jgi:hypothetical protein
VGKKLVSYCFENKKKVYGSPGPTGRMVYKITIRNNIKQEFSETKGRYITVRHAF